MRKVTKIKENNGEHKLKSKLRVAAYARVSTENADQLVSLEAQKHHYEAYIKANSNWEFVGIYYDKGVSGTKKEKRTELLRLISDCENRKIDFIITKSISRFARNTTDCLELVRKLTDIGVFIYFEKENINTQSMDSELMLSILSSLAENESVSISENNKWAIKRRFRNGTYKLSYPPYGYDYLDGEIVINKKQAEVVKRIFADALSGKGSQRIAQELNDEGVPTKRGGQWTGTTVRGILCNEKYTGDLLLQKTYTDETFKRRANKGELDQYFIESHHEAIISHADFEAVNEAIEQRGKEKGIKKGNNKYLNRYPFSGKIICDECGSTFKRRIHSSKTNKYIAWCCSKHLSKIKECSMIYIREDRIHEAFIMMVNKLIFSHKVVLKPLLRNLKSIDYADNLMKVQEIESKIEENTERVKVLVNLMTKGYLEPALFNTQKNELRVEAEKLKEQKKALYRSINGGMNKVTELQQLLKYASKTDQIERFNEEIFEQFVDRVIAFSPTEIGFELKCGVTLKERIER
ncbi:recombinase family protein [Anaerobacillus alkalilacustris]|uniref:Recombinase family protein n=1 Tax=Anaerobacillus alkalilacustris TaxID=393763 RepID=A0A1S2M065_9BACI|nr:recombinase family protein [Anaerobacillus alkalilacustris]OIJ17347.1 recombinase family protein [Anaerobacillus alkalilacustris]